MGIYDWFAGLATIGGFAYFMAGFGVSYAWWWWRCKMHHERVRVPWHLVGIAIGTMAIIIVTFQSSAAYNTAQKTAQDSKDCQHEFNTILKARAKITEENDRLSVVQRTALGDWLREILLPPPDIAQLRANNPNDPRVQEWGITITRHYSDIIQEAQRQQDDNFTERARHPLPDPTCGK